MPIKLKSATLTEDYKEHTSFRPQSKSFIGEADKSLISNALLLWGLTALVSGAVTAYSTTAFVAANTALKAAPALLAPYLLNILGGVFNLLFGVTLVALARKIKK